MIPKRTHLIAALSAKTLGDIEPLLDLVLLELCYSQHEPGKPIDFVYFRSRRPFDVQRTRCWRDRKSLTSDQWAWPSPILLSANSMSSRTYRAGFWRGIPYESARFAPLDEAFPGCA